MRRKRFYNNRGVLATLDALWNLPYTLEQELSQIMSAMDQLRDAVSGVETNVATGFTALQDAMAELASDIANLPNNADVEAEAARLSAVANTISEQTASFSAAIRDAIPTETVPNPEPVEGGDTGTDDGEAPTDGTDTEAPTDGEDFPTGDDGTIVEGGATDGSTNTDGEATEAPSEGEDDTSADTEDGNGGF